MNQRFFLRYLSGIFLHRFDTRVFFIRIVSKKLKNGPPKWKKFCKIAVTWNGLTWND